VINDNQQIIKNINISLQKQDSYRYGYKVKVLVFTEELPMTNPEVDFAEASNSGTGTENQTNNEPYQNKKKKEEQEENKYFYRFQSEQDEVSNNLRDKLNELRESLGATQEEIAKGLNISRKVLINFLKEESKQRHLSISRVNIKALWAYLTDSQRIEQMTKLSAGQKVKRENLRKEGPSGLLRVAGFVSDISLTDTDPVKKKKSYRIISRLSSSWVRDNDIWQIEETILNTILKERSESSLDSNNDNKERSESSLDSNNDNAEINYDEVDKWIKKNYLNSNSSIKEKFISVINSYAMSGKLLFDEVELFELYQSMEENFYLRRDLTLIENPFTLRVIGCEFRILPDCVNELDHDLLKRMEDIGLKAEKDIRNISLKSSNESSKKLVCHPVKESEITLRMTVGEELKTLVWRYSSVSNHIQNMLIALHRGMGYPPLKLENLSIRALGKTENSLARVSVCLRDKNTRKKYQGLWVDKDTLNALSQAVVIATESWVIETHKYKRNYSELCQKLFSVFDNLYRGRKAINDYHLHDKNEEGFKVRGSISYSEDVLKIVDEIRKDLNYADEEDEKIKKEFLCRLERHEHTAKLILLRSYHIEGRLEKVKDYLNKDYDQKIQNLKEYDINIFYNIEHIIYKLFSGERDYLINKPWRKHDNQMSLNKYTDSLKEYINKNKDERVFDCDLHICLSELFGNFGRLELYCCTSNDAEHFLKTEAIENFLKAAYFSSKIGNNQRVSHWLAHVSRVYSRLGEADNAEKYTMLARIIIQHESSYYRYSSEYKESILAEVNLAQGEIYLLKQEFDLALQDFIESLKGAIKLKFARLIADSLYGIYRALKQLPEKEKVKEKLQDLQNIKEKSQDFRGYSEEKSDQTDIDPTQKVIDFLSQEETYNNYDCICEGFKNQAKNIWQNWAKFAAIEQNQDEYKHPIAEAIERDEFLSQNHSHQL
jgi:hypothetical protein